MELSDELYDRIEELSETGNEAMESEDYAKAISCFQEALDILPEPKEDWEAYLWLVGSIGDAHFMMGNYGKSLEFFRKCYNIGETDNPFILLRLGENYLEMEDETNATEFLLRAYMQVMPLQSIWRNEASANHRILRLWRTRLSNVWCSVYGIWPRMTVSAALSSPQSISNVPVPETSHCTDTSAADNEKTAVCGQVKCLG